ncbi:RNA polymerase sigma factor [Caulobacter sp. LARHSG274]
MDSGGETQDERYRLAAVNFGSALERLARGYEASPDERRDLLQDIHTALWRSFAGYDARCSLRTWVYRIAHNVGASHILRRRAKSAPWASLDAIADAPAPDNPEREAGERQVLTRLLAMIDGLKPPDRQVMLLYLEDLDAAAIGEITGLSAGAVATKIHRIKAILARRFEHGEAP